MAPSQPHDLEGEQLICTEVCAARRGCSEARHIQCICDLRYFLLTLGLSGRKPIYAECRLLAGCGDGEVARGCGRSQNPSGGAGTVFFSLSGASRLLLGFSIYQMKHIPFSRPATENRAPGLKSFALPGRPPLEQQLPAEAPPCQVSSVPLLFAKSQPFSHWPPVGESGDVVRADTMTSSWGLTVALRLEPLRPQRGLVFACFGTSCHT